MHQLIQVQSPIVADKRFELRLSRRLMHGLALMSRAEGIPKAEVVRRALGLYSLALEEEAKGRLIGFGADDDKGVCRVSELIRLNATSPSSHGQLTTEGAPEGFERLELRVSQPLLEGIAEMSRAEGIPKADVVRRALGLYARALQEQAQGRLIVFANLDNSGNVEVVEAIRLS
jgi:hypothetical protein